MRGHGIGVPAYPVTRALRSFSDPEKRGSGPARRYGGAVGDPPPVLASRARVRFSHRPLGPRCRAGTAHRFGGVSVIWPWDDEPPAPATPAPAKVAKGGSCIAGAGVSPDQRSPRTHGRVAYRQCSRVEVARRRQGSPPAAASAKSVRSPAGAWRVASGAASPSSGEADRRTAQRRQTGRQSRGG